MQSLDFDKDKVIDNSDTLVAFSKAMAKVSALGAASGIGSMVQGMTEGITAFFGGDPPYQDVVDFSHLDIDAKKTKNNATAFKLFSEALSSYEGLGSGLGAISTALADSTAKFFGVKPPLEKFVYFSHLNINPKKADINSKAFVAFSNAMASYKGGPGLIDTISTLAGSAFGSLFGLDGPIEAFGKFANKDFGPNAAANANAFLKYAQGVGLARQSNKAAAAAAAEPTSPASSTSAPAAASAAAPAASSTSAPAQSNPAPAKAPAVQPKAAKSASTLSFAEAILFFFLFPLGI
jgi:cell division septation protein DedD